MLVISRKKICLISGLSAYASILFAYFYLENTLYLAPCPLCMMQRLAFFLIGTFFILSAFAPLQKTGINTLIRIGKYISIFLGIGLAARHLHIQSLPADQIPACGLDFYGLMNTHSWAKGLWVAMQGSGDCATPDRWLGVRIPVWSMWLYIFYLFIAVFSEAPKK